MSSRAARRPIRHARSLLSLRLLAGAGIVAGVGAAEQHLPPPRIPARRHHRAQRHAAGADDDAVGHAAARAGGDGGAGHPPRAFDDVPRRDRNLRAVRARHRHDRGPAAGAGAGSTMRGRRCRQAPISIVERLDARRVSDVHPQSHRRPCPAPTCTTTRFYVMRPRLARVPGAGQVEVASSDTREIEVVTDPARLLAAGLTVHDVAETLKAANQLAPVGRYSVRRRAAARARLGAVAVDRRHRRNAGCRSRPDGVLRVARCRPGLSRARPTGRASSPATAATPPASASRSRSAPTSSTSRPVWSRRVDELARALPAGLRITKVYDLAEFVARRDRERPRRHPHRRLARRHHPAAVPARLAADARRGDHAAARRHRRRSSSCGSSASRST